MSATFNSNMFDSANEQRAFDWLVSKSDRVTPDNFASFIASACQKFHCSDRNVWAEFCCYMNSN